MIALIQISRYGIIGKIISTVALKKNDMSPHDLREAYNTYFCVLVSALPYI